MLQSTRARRATIVRLAGSLLTLPIALFGCDDSTSPNNGGTFFGSTTAVGAGTARAYVTLDRSGKPTDIGIALSEAALNGLPAVPTEIVVGLPSQASATPYKHAVINWNPTGHPPPMVYTVPHFDVHFYTITSVERQAITLGDAQLAAKMSRRPAAEFIPTGYVADPGGVPGMGVHWSDPTSPEFNGQPFTRTFIYGSYDGAMIFAEPMITKAYLETKPAVVTTSLRLPTQYAVRGYHPTSYSTGYDAGAKEYRIALGGLVSR